MQKLCAFLQVLLHVRKAVFMAAVRGRPSGLPDSDPGSPTCVQLSPICLATNEGQSTFALIGVFTYGKIHAPHRNRPDPGLSTHRHSSPTRRSASHGGLPHS